MCNRINSSTTLKSIDISSVSLGGACAGLAVYLLKAGVQTWGASAILAEGIFMMSLPFIRRFRCTRIGTSQDLVHAVTVVNPIANEQGREARAARVAIMSSNQDQNRPRSTSISVVQLELNGPQSA